MSGHVRVVRTHRNPPGLALEVSTRGLGPRRDRPCSRVAMRPHARRTVRARDAAVAVRADALRIRVLDDQIVRLTMRSSKLTPKRYAW